MDCFCQTSNYHLFKIAQRFDLFDVFWDMRRNDWEHCKDVEREDLVTVLDVDVGNCHPLERNIYLHPLFLLHGK